MQKFYSMVNCLKVNYLLKNMAYSYLRSSLTWITEILSFVKKRMLYFFNLKFCKIDNLNITFVFKPLHMCSPKNTGPIPWVHGISLLITFSVIRFEETDQTWYSKILGGYSENLICSSDHRTEVKKKALLDLFMGFNKIAVAGVCSQNKTKISRNH